MVGVRLPAGVRSVSLFHEVQTCPVSHPASYQMETGALSPGVKRPGSEADHSPPYNADVKNGDAIPPLSNMFQQHSA
jgi:hypothetical protein